MAADGDPQEDATGSDLSDSSGASSSSPSPAPTPPAPPPHPPPVAVIGPPASSSATVAAPLPLHPHVYFQHQQRLISLQLSAASTPTPATHQRAPTITPLPISTEPPPAQPSERPFRDDCWSENATLTLIQAWGDRYLELNRGNLKQKHWKDVAHSVNARLLTSSKPPKTDVQCKNRLDTLKKKYKTEKSKLVTGGAPSKWAFFDRLDELIGSSKKLKTSSSGKAPRAVVSVADGNCTSNPNGQCTGTGMSAAKCMEEDVKQPIFFLPPQAAAPLPVPHLVSAGSVHLNHGAIHFNHLAGVPIYHHLSEGTHMNHHGGAPANHLISGIASVIGGVATAPATAPADTASKSKAGPDMSQSSPLETRPIDSKRSKRKKDRHRSEEENPFRDLARAISKFGEVYERVEIAKLQQMMDIEKQRMEFTKDLEIQRLELFMKTQVELAKMKYGSSKNRNAEHHG